MVGNVWDTNVVLDGWKPVMSFWGLFPIFRGTVCWLVWGDQQQDVGAEGAFVACDGTLARPLGIRWFFFWDFHGKKNLGN